MAPAQALVTLELGSSSEVRFCGMRQLFPGWDTGLKKILLVCRNKFLLSLYIPIVPFYLPARNIGYFSLKLTKKRVYLVCLLQLLENIRISFSISHRVFMYFLERDEDKGKDYILVIKIFNSMYRPVYFSNGLSFGFSLLDRRNQYPATSEVLFTKLM